MYELLANFHFIRPWWLTALLPLLLIIILFRKQNFAVSSWYHICDKHLIKHLLVIPQKKFSRWPLWIFFLSCLLIVFSLAGPSWTRISLPLYLKDSAKVIILDMSDSMNATDIAPSRLARARYKVLDILKRHREGQIGLVAFTKEPFIVSPLTQDSKTISQMIPELIPEIMPIQGSNIAWALQEGAKLIQQANYNKGQLILITSSKPTEKADEVVKNLANHGITTSVLSIGSQSGAPIPLSSGGFLRDENGKMVLSQLDEKSLKNLSDLGQGRYARFTDGDQDINYLLTDNKTMNLQEAKKAKMKISLWEDQGRWFILPLLIFALLGFRRGWFEAL